MEALELTPRQSRILKHIIEEYVVTALPVSSEAVVRRYEPRVSSATIRNEMVALQERGLLQHPHASAGRVPSDVGYRHYVRYLMPDARLSQTEERTILHQFHQVDAEIGEWLHLAAAVLASFIQIPVVSIPPVTQVSRLRRLDLVEMTPGSILLVVILWSGAVRQQLIRMEGTTASGLAEIEALLNDALIDKKASEIRAFASGMPVPAILEAVSHLMEEEDRWQGADVHVEGLSYMAGQPEFGTGGLLQPIVETLERPRALDALIGPLFQAQGVYISIGQEQPVEALRVCSAVLGTYGRPGEISGIVGVIGPTRLPYWRAVPMVEYVTGLLDSLLEGTFQK
ncbi:MAG: heat-inducible transcription repressor HrcA [Chloroflexi bacterium]|nr:heat-inducible transcription repressor HrcA [Chloroflexota bacterium]